MAQETKRIHLLDDKGEQTGRWFDPSKADRWDEGSRWNGQNHISMATGSQWDHQELFRSAMGTWILHNWSQWQGSGESYVTITAKEAASWLVQNEHEPHESLADYIAESEV